MVVSIRNLYSRIHVQEIPFDVLRVDSAMQDFIIQPHFIHIFDIPWPGSWRTALIRAYNSRASSSFKQPSASPRLSGPFWGRITIGWRCSKIITSIPKNAPSWNSWRILPCLSCNLEKLSEIHKNRPSQGIEDTVDMYGPCFMSNYTLRHGKRVVHKVVWFFPSCTRFLPIEGSCTGPRRGLLSRCKWVLGNWKHREEICGYRWYDQLFLQACQRMASLLFQVPVFPYLKSLRSTYIPGSTNYSVPNTPILWNISVELFIHDLINVAHRFMDIIPWFLLTQQVTPAYIRHWSYNQLHHWAAPQVVVQSIGWTKLKVPWKAKIRKIVENR